MKPGLSNGMFGDRRMTGGVESRTLHVVQGEFVISEDPEVVMVTILGSCVAACLRDPIAGIGGMNHFLLPGDMDIRHSGEGEREAVHMMELLVNGLLGRGASRSNLEAKIFGGACTMSGLADVGARNAEFAVQFLKRENISIVSECLGGSEGRRVQFWPVTGRARRSFMNYAQSAQPTAPKYQPSTSSQAGSLELF